jgi:hypothetical protein
MNFKKTKLAAAVGTAAMAMAMSAPANAVVIGGDNGWEVSLTGTINLFYNYIQWDVTAAGDPVTATTGMMCGSMGGNICYKASEDSSHLNEGLLPAFFTFKAVSPTVNGLTGTAQISFAPDSSSAKNTRQDKGGAAIDMREVFFNVDGSFGTISAGRTLGLFQRQAILKDQTLFGVGAVGGPDGGGTTLGRIGFGYVYPEFRTRFAYKTPTVNGFVLEVGVFDPQEPTNAPAGVWETTTPMFQGEATYNTTFQGGNIGVWAGGLWQDMDLNSSAGSILGNESITHWGIDVGADVGFSGFDIVGHYYTGQALGTLLKWSGGGPVGSSGAALQAPGFNCTATAGCDEADNDGYYIQGSYTFNGKTKIAGSYGASYQNDQRATASHPQFNDVSNEMWTIGVYHDVNSWLKLVAEYNDQDSESETPSGDRVSGIEAQTFSVGGFIFW